MTNNVTRHFSETHCDKPHRVSALPVCTCMHIFLAPISLRCKTLKWKVISISPFPFELIRCDLEPISTRVLNLVLESPGIQAAWAALLTGKRMFAKLWHCFRKARFNTYKFELNTPHCASGGHRLDLRSQQIFQQIMKIWCLGFHKINKRKKSTGGPTLLIVGF